MAFLESPRLDPKITAGARSTVRASRGKTYTRSGKLSQDFAWSASKHEMDVSHGVRSRLDFQALLDLFYVVMFTPYQGFRVKDWRDYQATQANTSATALGGNNWQLQRKHVAGAAVHLRNITKPVVGTVIVYRTRASVVTVASATIDYTTGIATISGDAALDTYTWTGEFDIPMTFVNDSWTGDLEVNTENLFVVSDSILLEELRP